MEIKKNPKFNLENYSKLFIQLGLVLALFVTYVAIEHKTYDKNYGDLGVADLGSEIDEETLVINAPPPPPPPPAAPPPPTPEKIEVVEDEEEIEETVIESTETDESEAVEVEEIVEAEEVEEIVEDVPFSIIEEVPVFPGCKGTNQQKKDCLNKKMRKHVVRHFDSELANELGLSSGKKRIYVQFKIDKDGSITSVNARAPHPRLKKEAERIAKKLPKMVPGRQRGKPVRVGYTLPITFNVE
ncbi:energy transducer TonB [Tenacibaculum sp. M341]|uniref:energy transducer TonB n=1 Tax=Tenacibaculum sp. M341 TaxID=2530339 RepID=UPI0010517ADA|nr:energy transducer TonB [Tenacibaculum sp. M341]TCI84452.1 energy transducer TonB [Tenacibaculum sp. M341]